jgi:integrase
VPDATARSGQTSSDMIKITYGISTSIVSSRTSYIVRIRVTYGGGRVDLRPGIRIERQDQWQDHRVKRGCKVFGDSYNDLNRRLTRYEEWIDYYFLTCEENSLDPSLDELRLWFNSEVSHEDESKEHTTIPRLAAVKKTFFELYQDFLEDMKIRHIDSQCKEDAIEPYLQLENRLLEFDKYLSLETLTRKKMIGFITHLAKTMYNDAINKRLTYLRCFINWVEENGNSVNQEYRKYNPSLKESVKEVRFLTVEEVDRLWNMELETSSMQVTRDMFIFQCYTGLRYSDLKTLTRKDFYSQDGDLYLRKITQKQKTVVDFKLSMRAKAIYDKYSKYIYPNDVAFPVLSNSKYNKHLKRLGHLANIRGQWKDIQYRVDKQEVVYTDRADLESHCGRRTFVCMAYNAGYSMKEIAEITGHKCIEDLEPYIKATHKLTNNVIDALDRMDSERRMKIVKTDRTIA